MWVPNSERGHKMSSLEGEMKSPTSPFVNEVFFEKRIARLIVVKRGFTCFYKHIIKVCFWWCPRTEAPHPVPHALLCPGKGRTGNNIRYEERYRATGKSFGFK